VGGGDIEEGVEEDNAAFLEEGCEGVVVAVVDGKGVVGGGCCCS
jgi:hypothetical protein